MKRAMLAALLPVLMMAASAQATFIGIKFGDPTKALASTPSDMYSPEAGSWNRLGLNDLPLYDGTDATAIHLKDSNGNPTSVIFARISHRGCKRPIGLRRDSPALRSEVYPVGPAERRFRCDAGGLVPERGHLGQTNPI